MTDKNLYPWLISELVDLGVWDIKKYFSAPGLIPVVAGLSTGTGRIKGLEIGVASGWNMFNFLTNIHDLELTGVDPYIPFQDWNAYVGDDILSAQYEAAKLNVAQFGDRATIIKDKCENIVDNYADGHFDYIFVDGDHSEEAVYRDCKNFYSKVRKGGVFSGHDFDLPAVTAGLNKFRSEGSYPQITRCVDNVWYWIKD